MAAAFSTTGKTLAFLPLLGVASPFAQAAEVPFPGLSPFPNQPDPMVSGSQVGQTAAIASPITPLADSMSVEASTPQFVAQVLPTDGATQTQVLVDAGGNQFDISGGAQAGENLFHRFDQLDLEVGQTANFQTPAGLEAVFSQVGGGPSTIDGTLKVSGSSADLFLLNPHGVVFGPNAQLDLNGSFTATTADRIQVGDQWVDLLEEGVTAQTAVAGSVEALEFSADAAGGAIANQGQLAVTDGQSLGLLGNAVVNTGSLSAPGGEVTILSASGGQRVSLEGGLLNLELPGTQAGATPGHSLPAVVAQPAAEATGLSLNADGSVSLQAGTSVLSGTVDVSSAEAVGGQVKVLGNDVQVTNSVVNASGAAGGEIHVGGDYQGRGDMLRAVSTRLDAASVLRADGIASTSGIRPDGGEVVVWSDGTAEFAGTATARSLAPGGDGGLVETSGKQQLNIASTSDVITTAVGGATGQWLIDPVDLTVVNGGGAGTIVGGVNDPGSSTIDASTIEVGLNGNNVALQADNSITVNASINASANPSGGDLDLDAPTLNLNERVTLFSGSDLSGTATTVNVGANGGVQNGIDAAATGGTVNLAAATYREGQEINIDKAVVLRGQGIASTILSGDAANDDITLSNLGDNHRVVNNTAAGTVIDGVTIANGVSTRGAGVDNTANGAGLTIQNSQFLDNQIIVGSDDGGAIANRGSLTVTNSHFERNTTLSDGGAIDANSGAVVISNSTFENNSAGDHGGAIDLDRGTLDISDSTFLQNTAAEDAGAINTEGQLTVSTSEFRENIAQIEGGAIQIQGGNAEFVDSNFIDNNAVQFGGAISSRGAATSNLTLRSTAPGLSLFQGNRVTSSSSLEGRGGAIFIAGASDTTVTDIDFVMNDATNDGGAIAAINGSNTEITNSNFRQNVSTGDDAGAVYIANSSTLTLNRGNFEQNAAVDRGGALTILRNSQATIDGTSFSENSVNNFGGALSVGENSDASLNNVSFDRNRSLAGSGGAIGVELNGELISLDSDFTSNTSVSQGGAIRIESDSEVTLNNNSFQSNQLLVNTEGNGGAIFVNSSSVNALSVMGGDFTNNSSLDDGGAVTINQGTAQFSDVVFASNRAINGDGGAVDVNAGATAIFQNGSFTNNRAQSFGGGIDSRGMLTVNGTNFTGNQATLDGGAIFVGASNLTNVQNADFINNRAIDNGGAIASQSDGSSQLTILDSTFDNNDAQQNGGGLYLDAPAGALLSLNQNSFVNNSGLSGGGLFKTNSADLTIANTTFERNTATDHGGGLAAEASNGMITLTDSRILQNIAGIDGGGIRLNASNLSASNSLILTNQTQFGGGLELSLGSTAQVNGSLFQGNTSSSSGGAIQIDNTSSATITNSQLLNNQSGSFGGAIFARGSFSLDNALVQANTAVNGGAGISLAGSSSGTVAIRSTTINGNNSSGGGGGLTHLGGQAVTIEDSTFSSNSAGGSGGAIDAITSSIQLSNSTISSNATSGMGGGISLAPAAQVDLSNVTVANNNAVFRGGGLANRFGGSLTLQNTIVAGNTAADDPDITGLITSLGNNIVQNRATSTGYVSADLPDGTDPLLLSLANNGGLTETHAVRVNSLAVDGGNAGATAADQRGLVAVNQRDIGAYELDNNLTVFTSGSGQTTTVNQPFANPIEFTIIDSLGSPIAGQNITVISGGAVTDPSASLGTLQTNSSGVASTTAIANTVAGGYMLTLDAGVPNRVYGLSLTNTADVPDQIAVLNGNNQSTIVNTAFVNPLQVVVTDQFGNQIPNQPVSFSLPGSGASANSTSGLDLNAIALVTDSAGQATVGLTANTIAGSYGVGLTSGGLSSNATLTNLPDLPNQLVVDSGNNQSTVVNTAFANPLQVTVTDQFGNVIPGVTVDVSLPGVGASANGGAIALTTDAAGQAATALTANTTAGSYSVGLTSGTAGNAINLTNLPDVPDQLTVVNGNNQSTVVNTAFANPLQVTVTDQFGNAVSGVTVDVSLPGSGASANAGATTLTTDATGQATTGLVANTTAGAYSLGLSAGSLANSLQLVNLPDAPARLDVLTGDNQSQVVDAAFTDPLLVQVADQFGNVIPGAIVNLSLPGTGATAQAGSVALTTDSLGQASTQFVANTVAGAYAVGLASGNLNNSISLSNLPDSPAQLDLLAGNDQVAQINTAFADELRIQVVDQFGNAIPGATVTFTAPVAGVPSAALSAEVVTADGAGQSQTLATANGLAGSYQVQAQAGAATAVFELENTVDTPLPELPTVTERPLASLPSSQPVENFSSSSLTASTPLSFVNTAAIEAIDSSFSSAYTNHWGTPASTGVTVAETRELLQNAAEVHGVKSAVVYGLFVPQESSRDEGFGATQVASMALNRRAQTSEQHDDDQFMLVLVPNEGPPLQRLVSVTRQEVLQQARLFRMAVSDPYDEWSYKPLAQQMYSWMLEPVESELERLKLDNVMYVMDAGLRTLPLAAMMKGDEFAIERYGISLIPSVDLMETNFGASAPSSQIVAAGATEFERLNDLPAVELELDAIASQAALGKAQNSSVNVLFNESFTQENLLQAQQQSKSNMLHLATHGEFNAGDLGSSYLQFWDDQLTLDDISKLGWDELELLILSACQTAISSPEAELGFAGLAAATGVESTIGSLWSVSDIGTLGLMSEFYGQLSQTPLRFEALRQAQMAMLRGETRLEQQQLQTDRGEIALPEEWDLPESADFSHPFYWSGFTLVGNPWW